MLVLGGLVRLLEQTVPAATKGTAFGGIATAIEYPVYAIVLGPAGQRRCSPGSACGTGWPAASAPSSSSRPGWCCSARPINIAVIVSAAGPAILQALVLISVVFGFTWWLGGRLGLDDKLRALLASAVSICGVSAAIAAAGAVQAKKEQLAYTASMVIIFALPSIFLLPAAAGLLGLTRRWPGPGSAATSTPPRR